MLQINVNGGVLDLPENIELSIEEVNPIFSDEISSSLPVKVSYTLKNLALLGHPEFLGNMISEVNLPCRITHESYHCEGVIKFIQVKPDDREIEFSMLLDEVFWYEWAKKTKLKDISWPEAIKVSYAKIGDKHADYKSRIEWVNKLMISFFELWQLTGSKSYNKMLLSYDFCDAAFLSEVSEEIVTNGAEGRYFTYIIRKYNIVNQNSFKVGACTPLLFYRTVLKYLFKDFEVQGNPFLEGDLARVFLFNDSITYFEPGDVIDYSNLVPDVTVDEFIKSVEAISGTKVIVDWLMKTVSFVKIKNNLLSTPVKIQSPIKVSINDLETQRFTITTELVDCDYSKTHEHCNRELLESGKFKTYDTVNYEHTILRNKGDKGKPWETIFEYQEQVIFDKSLQCFGIEKWAFDTDKWMFKREFLSNSHFKKTVGDGEKEVELKVPGVVHNALTCFNRYFWDSEGEPLNLEFHYVLQLPFYPCRFEGSAEEMHDYEKIAFNIKENAPKLGVSIFRGWQKVFWRKNTFDVHQRQNGTRDIYESWGEDGFGYTDNRDYYSYANSDIYDTAGNVIKFDESTQYPIEYRDRGRLAKEEDPLALKADNLHRKYYVELAKFISEGIPCEVAGVYEELNDVDIKKIVEISYQKFAIMKRYRTLTLHCNVVAKTDLKSIPIL